MNLKANNKGVFFVDMLLWAIIVLLIGVGIVSNFYFANYALPVRLIGWVALILIIASLSILTQGGRVAWNFIKQAQLEMRKVVWPSRQETVQTTLVVLGMVIFMALLLWGVDTLLLWIIGLLTGQTG